MQKQFQYNNSLVYYTLSGNGQTVVLLHGFAEDGHIWDEQIAFLQEHCQFIIPDLPGSGKSALLQKENVTIVDYAECIHALLVYEKADNCIMLGHSMGGYIMLAFAEMYSGKLKAFGFVHSTAFADSADKKNTRKKGIQFIKEHGAYSFIKNTTPNLFSEAFKKEHPEKIAAFIEQGENFSEEALTQYYTAMMNRPDRTSVLAKSDIPVLFIIGEEDVAAPLEDLLKQVHLPKIAHIHIIKGVGHISMMEKPAELNRYLLEFITNCL